MDGNTKISDDESRVLLCSNSAPTTSSMNRSGSKRHKCDPVGVTDDLQTDNDSHTLPVLPQVVKGQLGNPDLTDDPNANYKIPTQPTLTSLQGDDRDPRVDVLWKVKDDGDESPNSITSIGNCHFEVADFPKESKFIPPFNKMDVEKNQPSRTVSETNNNPNMFGIEKKGDEEEEGNHNQTKSGHQADPRRFSNLDRREPFSCPWSPRTYHVTYHFENPRFRTKFSSKILLLKTLEWLTIAAWTLVAKNIKVLTEEAENLMWSLYIAGCLYVITHLAAGSTNTVESNLASYITLAIYTVCLSHVSASLYIFTDYPFIPTVLLTLGFSYVVVVLLFSCLKIDAYHNTVFFPMTMSVFGFSIVSFWIVMHIRNANVKQTTNSIGTTWIPTLFIAQIIASIEMSEIQSVISGNRAPLRPEDWPLASIFLM